MNWFKFGKQYCCTLSTVMGASGKREEKRDKDILKWQLKKKSKTNFLKKRHEISYRFGTTPCPGRSPLAPLSRLPAAQTRRSMSYRMAVRRPLNERDLIKKKATFWKYSLNVLKPNIKTKNSKKRKKKEKRQKTAKQQKKEKKGKKTTEKNDEKKTSPGIISLSYDQFPVESIL